METRTVGTLCLAGGSSWRRVEGDGSKAGSRPAGCVVGQTRTHRQNGGRGSTFARSHSIYQVSYLVFTAPPSFHTRCDEGLL
jgi:hypothetical protein